MESAQALVAAQIIAVFGTISDIRVLKAIQISDVMFQNKDEKYLEGVEIEVFDNSNSPTDNDFDVIMEFNTNCLRSLEIYISPDGFLNFIARRYKDTSRQYAKQEFRSAGIIQDISSCKKLIKWLKEEILPFPVDGLVMG